jgi:glycosyltransferase involved in cell wall biosynthesis
MKIGLVVPTMASGERGGAEALYAGLLEALHATGNNVEQVEVAIDESTFEAVVASYLACFDLDLSAYDMVISTKAPTYMVQHPNHVSYLLHTLRVYYDMFEREYGTGTSEQRRQRALIHQLDLKALHPDHIKRFFANGRETFERLYAADLAWRTVPFRALHHPPALDGFREPTGQDYLYMPGRLHRWKRADLVIRALAYVERDIRLVISGSGEDEPMLRELAERDPRIQFVGRIQDSEVLDLYAGALAVPFVPQHEDYGLVTIEAFRSQKPVITCTDSGEPTRFVRNYQTGFVVEPDAGAIAEKITYLVDHRAHAAKMGRNGRAAVAHIQWAPIVAALLNDGARTHRAVAPRTRGFAEHRPTYNVAVLDMQPIEPPVGGGRVRLLGLYHGLGPELPTRYFGTYDWPGEAFRRLQLSDTLEEITVPLSNAHFVAAGELAERAGGKTIIDVAFPRQAHLSPDYLNTVGDGVDEAEIVVFSHPWIYPLVKDRLQRQRQLVVYDAHNIEGLLRMSLLDDGGVGSELVQDVVAMERALCQTADLVLACSHEDRRLFHELYGIPYAKMLIAPNGTFTRRLRPADARRRRQAREQLGLSDIGDTPIALFLGSLYPPNAEAAEFIVRTVAPALPGVIFAICGGVGAALDTLLGGAKRVANVLVSGPLSDEERALYLASANVALNPIFSGSGTNVKMFDFMAAGLPLVATPVGARGIPSTSEEAFLVRAPADFAAGTHQLLSDDAYAEGLAGRGSRLVEQSFSWERISAQLGARLHRARARLGNAASAFSVVIPTYNRHDRLYRLMDCLLAQTYRDFEVIIVDQTAAPWQVPNHVLAGLDILYLHTDIRGAINARNTGAFHARGDVIAFTDDDCQPTPDWLEHGAAYFTDPGVVGVEGLVQGDRRDDPKFRPVTNQGFEGLGFMTANLLVRRETFSALDGFDVQFDHPHFREDTDLGWRLLDHGKVPFAQDVRVFHPSHRRDNERESLQERNRFFEKDALLLRKHPRRYRELFLKEGHYRWNPGFREHFLRGAEKYGVRVDEFYRHHISAEGAAAGQFHAA